VQPPFSPDLRIGPLSRGPDAGPCHLLSRGGVVLGGDIGPCHEPDTVNQARALLVSGHYLTPTATIISQGPSKPDGPSK
jgi:hypothetical protein